MYKQRHIRKAGVWMDHMEAHIIDSEHGSEQIHTIRSLLEHHVRIDGEHGDGIRLGNYRSTNNEAHKHHREQNQLDEYYRNIAEVLSAFDEILIFGPTTAHNELYNYLCKDKQFNEKLLLVKNGDYINENQMRVEIEKFFHGVEA